MAHAGCRASDSICVQPLQALPEEGSWPHASDELGLEGYGPGGTAIVAVGGAGEAARAELRALFSAHGGHLGAPGSVAYLFNRVGLLHYPAGGDPEAVAQLAYAAGAEDVIKTGGGLDVLTAPGDLAAVRAHVAARGVPAGEARVIWRAWQTVPLEGGAARQMRDLLRRLALRDDVGSVYSNAQIPDEILAQL